MEVREYNERYEKVNWETCSLRHYLNDEFFSNLPREVKQRIVKIENKIFKHDLRSEPWEFTVSDKVFLLSKDEANIYFSSLLDQVNPSMKCLNDKGNLFSSEQDSSKERLLSPMEKWHEDSRQYLSSAYDECAEEEESVVQTQKEHDESVAYQYMDEAAERDRAWRERSFWAAKYKGCTSSWWFRTTTDDDLKSSVQFHHPSTGSLPAVDILGIRPALCISLDNASLESCINTQKKNSYKKPGLPSHVDLHFNSESQGCGSKPDSAIYDEDIPF